MDFAHAFKKTKINAQFYQILMIIAVNKIKPDQAYAHNN